MTIAIAIAVWLTSLATLAWLVHVAPLVDDDGRIVPRSPKPPPSVDLDPPVEEPTASRYVTRLRVVR